ncbi:MAG: membrane protein insertase YidC [Desulfurellaceae bacterium]|jgi:YidC/Oxa1 family membrane protein insertase|nr:membrane protein insertase YidC [Desulfurellaceae bacterium]
MEKNVIIAFALSFFIFIIYGYFFMSPAPKKTLQEKAVVSEKVEKKVEKERLVEGKITRFEKRPAKTIVVSNNLYTATLSSQGAVITNLDMKSYKGVKLIKKGGLYPLRTVFFNDTLEKWEQVPYMCSIDKVTLSPRKTEKTVVFEKDLGEGYKIVKMYTFFYDSYLFSYKLEFLKDGRIFSFDSPFSIYLGPDLGSQKKKKHAHIGSIALIGNKLCKDKKINNVEGNIQWIGQEDKYFCFLAIPEITPSNCGFEENEGKNSFIKYSKLSSMNLSVYAGPKQIDILKSYNHELSRIVTFGMFGFIGKPLLYVLKLFYNMVGNYGIAILILTFLIRLVFYPLGFMSFRSMRRMQNLQPQLKEVQAKYKGKQEQISKATMELYKRNKVNPFGGCLPMLVQIPIFIALYSVLLNAIELRGAPFVFWIHDLSVRDPYFITPILMGASMYVQQKIMPASIDPKQAKLMAFLPVIFTVMFLNFPSGLVIYWLFNNILTVAQQIFIDAKRLKVSEQKKAG